MCQTLRLVFGEVLSVHLGPIHLEKFRKTQEIPEKPGWLTVESLRGLFEGSPSPTASLELEFTRDVVQVDIRGREFQALQLIDLPGLIASAPNAELVSLIRDLCSDYIRRENTLIAMCCPFDDDLENQEAFASSRHHPPTSKPRIETSLREGLRDNVGMSPLRKRMSKPAWHFNSPKLCGAWQGPEFSSVTRTPGPRPGQEI